MSSFDLRAALTVIALVGCGADDFTTTGTASSQGGAGSTVASTGAGASGAAGGGGSGECSGGSICVPAAPVGWSGPAAVYVGARPPAACDAPWVMAFTANAGKLDGPFDCETCLCSPPTGTTCSTPTVTVYANGNCSGTMEAHQLSDGGCTDFNGGYGAKATPSAPGGGSCMPSGGVPAKRAPTWELEALVCEGAPNGGACVGGECLPAPAAPFGVGLCIYKDGDEACPGAFTEKAVVYGGLADTRDCSPCSCDVPTGASCADAITVYDDAACTAASVPPIFVADGTCKTANYVTDLGFDAAAVGGSCALSGGEPTGELKPAAPVTICCTAS